MKGSLVFVVGLLAISPAASAQYVVGDTQYTCPVGVPWNDPRCIRQPIDQGADTPPLPPQPAGRWVSKWGAIAIDSIVGDVGATEDELSEDEAKRAARERCEKHGAKDCEFTLVYSNQCGVIAWPSVLNAKVTSRAGPTIEAASKSALAECMNVSGAACKIVYSKCSMPVFEKF